MNNDVKIISISVFQEYHSNKGYQSNPTVPPQSRMAVVWKEGKRWAGYEQREVGSVDHVGRGSG
jgi:hypothetical protein